MDKQKNNKKIVLAAVCLAIAVATLLAIWHFSSPKGAAGEKKITVEVVHGDGTSRSFQLSTDAQFLGSALIAGGVVEDNQGAYGLYILTADGETASEDNQEWWKLTKNGEMVNTGADDTPIANGETYELTLTIGYDAF